MAELLFDQAQRCSWNGVELPIVSIKIRGGIRHHVHEYPHQAGGDLEKLGRRLYRIFIGVVCDEGIEDYPRNYPNAIEAVFSYAEQEKSADLVLPVMGTIKVALVDWDREWSSAVRSGETMSLEFVEDQEITDLDVFSSKIRDFDRVSNGLTNILALRPKVPEVPQSLFDQLTDAVTNVLSFRDLAEYQALLLEGRIQSVASIVTRIDKAIKTPLGYQVVQACIDLVNSTKDLNITIAEKVTAFSFWTVPAAMAITDISSRIFGRSTEATKLLQLNAIDDAFAIPAGTQIRYIPDVGSGLG